MAVEGMEQSGTHPNGGKLPEGMVLSIPWNHDIELLERLEERKGQFERLYAPFHPEMASSCRAWAGPASVDDYTRELERVCQTLQRCGAGLSLVANAPRWPIDQKRLVAWAHGLAAKVPRLRVVFADLDHARRAAPELDGIEIGVSTTANVASVHEASLWMEFGQAKVITVGRHINRKLDLLRSIKALGVGLSLVAYDVCIPSCPFSGYHFGNIPVGDPSEGVFRHVHLDGCHPVSDRLRRERPYLLAVKEILPGHLHHYARLVDELKLPGRNRTTVEVLRSMDLYLEGTSLEHPYRLYTEPPEAWERIATCNRDCHACGYCEANIVPGTVDVFASPVPKRAMDDGGPRVASGWEFSRDDGGKATICASPKGPHRVLREVAGQSIHYSRESGASSTELVALVNAVADALAAAGYHPQTNPTPTLSGRTWPHGFKLDA